MLKEIVVTFLKLCLTCIMTYVTSVAFYSFFLYLHGSKREEILLAVVHSSPTALILLFACMVLILTTIGVIEWTLPGLFDYFIGGLKRTHATLEKQVQDQDKLAATMKRQLEAVGRELDAIRSHELLIRSIIDDNELRSELHDAWQHECERMITTLREESGEIQSSLTANGMRILWSKLPYFEHFQNADVNAKAMYFEAVSSGDWTRVVKWVRKRSKGES